TQPPGLLLGRIHSCSVGLVPEPLLGWINSCSFGSKTTRTSLQPDGSLQYLIFGTLVRSLERVFSGERGNDMTDVDLVATSSCPRTVGPSTWSTRRVGAGLTQAWKGQPSYGRPDKGNGGKVDIPQLQEGRHAPRRKDHEQRGEVQYCGKQ
ncbi:hypothetical protein BHM03_00011574, partial [Ensete ventricosum]